MPCTPAAAIVALAIGAGPSAVTPACPPIAVGIAAGRVFGTTRAADGASAEPALLSLLDDAMSRVLAASGAGVRFVEVSAAEERRSRISLPAGDPVPLPACVLVAMEATERPDPDEPGRRRFEVRAVLRDLGRGNVIVSVDRSFTLLAEADGVAADIAAGLAPLAPTLGAYQRKLRAAGQTAIAPVLALRVGRDLADTAARRLEIELTDCDGEPLAGRAIRLALPEGVTTVHTGARGRAAATVTPRAGGATTIRATYRGPDICGRGERESEASAELSRERP